MKVQRIEIITDSQLPEIDEYAQWYLPTPAASLNKPDSGFFEEPPLKKAKKDVAKANVKASKERNAGKGLGDVDVVGVGDLFTSEEEVIASNLGNDVEPFEITTEVEAAPPIQPTRAPSSRVQMLAEKKKQQELEDKRKSGAEIEEEPAEQSSDGEEAKEDDPDFNEKQTAAKKKTNVSKPAATGTKTAATATNTVATEADATQTADRKRKFFKTEEEIDQAGLINNDQRVVGLYDNKSGKTKYYKVKNYKIGPLEMQDWFSKFEYAPVEIVLSQDANDMNFDRSILTNNDSDMLLSYIGRVHSYVVSNDRKALFANVIAGYYFDKIMQAIAREKGYHGLVLTQTFQQQISEKVATIRGKPPTTYDLRKIMTQMSVFRLMNNNPGLLLVRSLNWSYVAMNLAELRDMCDAQINKKKLQPGFKIGTIIKELEGLDD